MVYSQIQRSYGVKLLSSDDISEYESLYPDGMTSAEIVNIFSTHEIKFSEANLRKYVQQGLLPRSQRVGQKGKHKGSRGVYPSNIIKQINEIKKLMAMDYTIEEIQNQFAFVDGEMSELKVLLDKILAKLKQSAESVVQEELVSSTVTRQLGEATRSARLLVEQLETTVEQIRVRAHMARNAV